MRFLIVRLGSLGDLVHALPVAAALRERHPAARIDWLVDARYSSLLDFVPVIDRRVIIAPAGGLREDRPGHPGDRQFPGTLGILRAIRFMRREQYDAAIDLQGLIKSAVLARASGASRVIGFADGHLRERQARFFYSETVTPGEVRGTPDAQGGGAELQPCSRHVVGKNLSVLPALDAPVPARPAFPIDVPLSPSLDTIRQALGQLGARDFALLNPGAAWPNKRWPADRFGAVAAWLRSTRGLASVVTWGPGEEGLAKAVAASSGGAALAAPPTSIGDLLAIAREGKLVVSGDTGPLHLAAAVGTPIVALFGPTDPGRNGPWDAGDITLSRYTECVCHYERRCRRDRPCIEHITVEDLLGAIEQRLVNAPHARA